MIKESIFNKTEMPVVLPLKRVLNEGRNQKSIFVEYKGKVMPGQFFMVWIPSVDAKPYAVSYRNKNEIGFTSQAIGKFSNAFDKLEVGKKIGLFGPYGNSFSIKNNACVVAGGIGISSVSTLIDRLKSPIIIYGARNKELLIYLKRYKNKNMIITTDNGSFGQKGFTTDVLDRIFKNKSKKNKTHRIKMVYACGPEIMIKKVLDICNRYNVQCEVSIERFMSCGFGICGKCVINDRITCIDGPVFNSRELNQMDEFGKLARLKSCKKIPIEQYHKWRA